MKENLKTSDEEHYEQFETSDKEDSNVQIRKKNNKSFLYTKTIIKTILLTVSFLCLLIIIFQFLERKNKLSEIYKSKKEEKPIKKPLEESKKCEP